MNTAKVRNNYHTSQLVACGSECKNLSNLWTLFEVNEGLVKVYVDTRDPQSLNSTTVKAAFVTKFMVTDGAKAPTFLYRGGI